MLPSKSTWLYRYKKNQRKRAFSARNDFFVQVLCVLNEMPNSEHFCFLINSAQAWTFFKVDIGVTFGLQRFEGLQECNLSSSRVY